MGHFLLNWWNKHDQRLTAWITIIGFPALVGSWFLSPTPREIVFASGLVLVFVGGAVTFLIMSLRLGRKARYAEAMANVQEAVHAITVESLAEFHGSAEKKEALRKALRHLSNAFAILTGSNCRCCIKTIVFDKAPGGELMVKTLCRDSATIGGEREHPLLLNTDFSDLYHDKNLKWYVGNNLPVLAESDQYENTSSNWMSRYRSTVIWPIRPDPSASETCPDFLGFRCVDSKMIRPFSEEYDYPVGALVADALCPFLMKMAESERAEHSPSQSLPLLTKVEATEDEPPRGVPRS